ncbi:hypothetical protein SELMODRAFT_415086 [Selaginella moellendorffii]|uniref:Uncharacterized protein n=1 Tax=Selaginella moellendorffii TaxID=88036 RepID=D8RUZ1_SELML|nr:hypothetical protein SELMODRAFT_415086 [Selaginella moellendorffii]
MAEEESEPDCRVWYAVVSNGATLYPSEDAVISSGSQRCFDATEGMELSEVLGEIMGHHPSVVVCVLRGAKTKGWYPIADTRSASTVMKKGSDIFMKLVVQDPLPPLVRPAEGVANFAVHQRYAKELAGRICHLEAWQMEDLVACKNALGLSFSDEDIKRRFEICGGLPRAAVGLVKNWERVVDCAGSCIEDPDIPDLLLHYKLEKDENGEKNVEKMHLEFGSSRIETLSLDSLQTKGQAHRFFNHCQHIGWAGALAGKVYARHVLNELEGSSQGRKYKMRCLATGKILVHEIRYKQVKRMVEGDESVQNSKKRKKGQHSNSLLTAADARGTNGLAEWTFVEPYASNQKAFDGIGLADLKTLCKVYQVTVAEEHPLSWSKLAEVIADKWYKHRQHKLPPCYELVFVVPEHMFHSIKEQKYLQDDGRRYGVQLDAMKRLKQVVISVPW